MNKVLLASVLSLATISTLQAAPHYEYTDLNMSGGFRSTAYGINNLNQIIGTQQAGDHGDAPALWSGSNAAFIPGADKIIYNSTIQDINDKGQVLLQIGADSTSSVWDISTNFVQKLWGGGYEAAGGSDINNGGVIVGGLVQGNDVQRAMWNSPKVEPTLLDNSFTVIGINDLGHMAGSYNFSGQFHAAIKNGDEIKDLGTLGGNVSSAMDVTDSGFAIGVSEMANGNFRNFLWDGDNMRVLDMVPGLGGLTFVESINEQGQSVGSQFFDGMSHAVFWNGTRAIDLNTLLSQDVKDNGWVLWSANDINDAGWIVGEARNTFTNEIHAFSLSSRDPISPIPEPSTYAMLLAGLGLVGFMLRRKESLS